MSTDERSVMEKLGLDVPEAATDDLVLTDSREALVGKMIDEAVDWHEQNLEPEQALATDYYMGEPFGDEKEGRSQVVMPVVRDVVRMIMPSLMRIFMGSDRVVEFEPEGPEDVALARQQTDYVNYIVTRKNPGYRVLWSAFKDALVRKLGPIKWWYDEDYVVEASEHTGLMPDQIALLQAEKPGWQFEVTPSVLGEPLFDVRAFREHDRSQVRIAAIPPDEYIFSPNARTTDDARIVGHIRETPANELIEMGVDPDLVARGKGREAQWSDDLETARRKDDGTARDLEDEQHEATRPVMFAEVYVLMPVDRLADDDELTEKVARHKCLMVGTGGAWEFAFEPEIVDEVPITDLCPDPEPHTKTGLSVADLVMDIQRIYSQIWRGVLDSLASHLDPATEVVEGKVNMADVLNEERGRVIRVRQPGMMREVATEFVGGDALPILHSLDDTITKRTGVSKASQGLDADALQSSTKAAVAATLSAAQQQIELIARNFAEGGIKDLFRSVLRLVVRHQNVPEIVRLRGEFQTVDPNHMNADLDLTVNVALGAGTPEERLQLLGLLAEKQEQHLQVGSPLVDLVNLRNTYARMVELAGFKNPDEFFQSESAIQQKLAQIAAQPPTPSADERLERIEMAKIEQRMAEARLEAEVDIIQEQIKAGVTMSKAEIDARLKALDLGLKREQAEIDAVLAGAGTDA